MMKNYTASFLLSCKKGLKGRSGGGRWSQSAQESLAINKRRRPHTPVKPVLTVKFALGYSVDNLSNLMNKVTVS